MTDRSGLRIWLSSTLRENDAAVLETGMPVDKRQFIPPKSEGYLTQGICHGDCLTEVDFTM